MMTTVKLYGHLGRRFGRRHEFDLDTVGEFARMMEANFPGFRKYVIQHSEPGYHIISGKRDLSVHELGIMARDRVIRVVPAVEGGGKSPWVSVIIGVALIWATGGFSSFGMSGMGVFSAAGTSSATVAAGTMATGAGALAGMSGIVSMVGVSMVLGGVSQLLSGTPTMGTPVAADQRTSFGFNGPVNTTQQGVPVPLCYGGPIRIGGARISSSVEVEDVQSNGKTSSEYQITNMSDYDMSYDSWESPIPQVSQALGAKNGTVPYTWSIIEDVLGGVFSIDTGDVLITTALAYPGDYAVVVRVTDADSKTCDQRITFHIHDTYIPGGYGGG